MKPEAVSSTKLIKPANIDPEVLDHIRQTGGTWAAYQNHDLDHPHFGHLKFLKYGSDCTYKTPPFRLPDTPEEINCRYLLVGKVHPDNGMISQFIGSWHAFLFLQGCDTEAGWQHRLRKNTTCGAQGKRTMCGIELGLGLAVEDLTGRALLYPFSEKDYNDEVRAIEEEAVALRDATLDGRKRQRKTKMEPSTARTGKQKGTPDGHHST